MTYAAEHASALVGLSEAGAAVTFSLETPGDHDAETETFTSLATSTVTGSAIEVASNTEELAFIANEQIQGKTVTLLFAPGTYGELPAIGSTFTWVGEERTIIAVRPLRPDGTAILARIIAK